MWYLSEREKTGHLSDLLEWGNLIAGPQPCVVRNKDGALMATLQYDGADVAMLDPVARASYVHRLNRQLMRPGTGWCLLADQWHEPVTSYPTSQWTNPTAAFVDASRRAQLSQGGLYGSDQFLTLLWHPGSAIATKFYERWLREDPPAMDADLSLGYFTHELATWTDNLTGLFPDWHWLDADETCTYLQRCVSWRRHRVGCPELPQHLAHLLTVDDFLPGDTPQLGQPIPGSQPPRLERYVRPIGIQAWPKGRPEDGGGLGMEIPRLVNHVPFPYRYSVRYQCLDVADAEVALKAYKGRWESMLEDCWTGLASVVRMFLPGDAAIHVASAERGLQSLRAGDVRYGYITPIVTVWGDTMEELTAREREVLKLLRNEGLSPVPETTNAIQAWVGSQPGDTKHNANMPPFPSLGLAFIMPHAAIWQGEKQDYHLKGPSLFMASSDMAPFYFALHPRRSESGSTMLIAPRRTGKSAQLALWMSQFTRYPHHQIFAFDNQESLKGCTLFHGGAHYALGRAGGHGSQPFGQLDQGLEEQRWALNWVLQVLKSRGVMVTPHDDEQLWLAIQRLAAFPLQQRTITGFVQLLQVQALKQALKPFQQGGPYGFMDANHDDIVLADWTCFEMHDLLAMPDVLPHELRYRFHRIRQRMTGRPTLFLVDEAHKCCEDETFGTEIFEDLKENPKLNVSTVLATQEVAYLAQTKVWHAILNNIDTWVFGPNPAATQPGVAQYYRECGLTEYHMQMLAVSTPKQDWLYKEGARVRRYQLAFHPVDILTLAASTPEQREALHQLLREEVKEPLLSAWLRRHDMAVYADIFAKEYACKEAA